MPGLNLAAKRSGDLVLPASCVFVSFRLGDVATAAAVATFLMDVVQCHVYFSPWDGGLKEAVASRDHQQLVASIDEGLRKSTHLLGIISNQTRGSWWVPYEFGASRHRDIPIAVLLIEDVEELPSYMSIARLLLDVLDLQLWVSENLTPVVRSFSKGDRPTPIIPRLPAFRSRGSVLYR